jgi:hypothetical protein
LCYVDRTVSAAPAGQSRLPSADVIVIGYGSLMSGFGLQPFGALRARAAARVALRNVRRGFGKLSQHGDRFALVLESSHPSGTIEGGVLDNVEPPTDSVEGVALLLPPTGLARVCEREGYSSGALHRLRDEAAARRLDLAAFLWSLLDAALFDVPSFRQRLFKLVGYTSAHYLPHPVRLDDGRFAVTFIAPGREGSGAPHVVPVRVRDGTETLMTAAEAWRQKPNRAQLSYIVACLLGGAHGVAVGDIIGSLNEDPVLAARTRELAVAEQPQELTRFLETTGLDHASYWAAFGPPNQSTRRSGLDAFLAAGPQPTRAVIRG